MFDFGYCIWLQPIHDHEWYTYTEGFEPHITLAYNLTCEEAHNYIKNFNKQKIEITLDNNVQLDCDEDFYSLYYNVISKHPLLPNNAHMSFLYQYDKPFCKNQIEKIKNKMKARTGVMENISIVKCSGHFSTWKKQ